MKRKRQLLLASVALVALGIIAVLGQDLPRTLPSKPVRMPYLKSPEEINGAETRRFHLAGNEYSAVLFHRELKASPEWNPTMALPLSLAAVEANARTELHKLVTDAPEWETSSIQLNRVSQSAEQRWYYAVSFYPVLRLSGLPHDTVIIMLTIDGKPGHCAKDQRQR